MVIAIKHIPPDAIAEAIPPEANIIDYELPVNFHFLKRFKACL